MTASNTLKIYCAASDSPAIAGYGEISHRVRAADISAARNAKVREQKTFVWNLLAYAIKDYFGIDIEEAALYKSDNGKWHSSREGLFFSLSHTDEMCAVAVSKHPCGVDAEKCDTSHFGEAFSKRVLTDSEYREYETFDDDRKKAYTAIKWTQKESIFKQLDKEFFVPSSVETGEYFTATKKAFLNDCVIFVSASCKEPFEASFVSVDDSMEFFNI